MNVALCLRIDVLHLCVCQVAHDIDFMCGQIERYPYIANARGKGAKATRVQVIHFPQFTSYEVPLYRHHGRVKAFDMPNRQPGIAQLCQLNERARLLNCTRHRLFDQHVDTQVEHVLCYLKMQVSGDNHRHEIRACLFYHLTVTAITGHMETADCTLQIGLVRLRYPYNLHLLLAHISQYSQVVHPHRTGTDNGNFQSHKARTPLTIIVRSSRLSAGWTGSESTCSAAVSVTGKLPIFRIASILPVAYAALVLSQAATQRNSPRCSR